MTRSLWLAAAFLAAASSARADGPKAGSVEAPAAPAPSGPSLGGAAIQAGTLDTQAGGPGLGAAAVDLPPAAADAGAAAPSGQAAAAFGAVDPGTAQGAMVQRALDPGGMGRQLSSARAQEAKGAPGGVERALNSRYDNAGAFDPLNANPGFSAVSGRAPALAAQVRHEVTQGDLESARPNSQALGFYQAAIGRATQELKAGRAAASDVQALTAYVLSQARAHAVTRVVREPSGETKEVPGALQNLAAGVAAGDARSVSNFGKAVEAWEKFLGVPVSNRDAVLEVLSRRPENGRAPAIRFFDRGPAVEADLAGLAGAAAPAETLIAVPRTFVSELALKGASAVPSAASFEAPAMPEGFAARLLSNARLRERAGAPPPAAWARAAWSAARTAARSLWEAAAGLVARAYGALRPARLDVGGAPLVSSDRALLRLRVLRPRRLEGLDTPALPVLSVDLSALSDAHPDLDAAAALHGELTGDSSAAWFAAHAAGAAQREDWRLKIAQKAVSQIDRELLSAVPGRAVAYADLSSGVARLLVRDATPVESAELQSLGFDAGGSGGVWIGSLSRADRATLEAALSVLGGRPQPSFDAPELARAFASAKKARRADWGARRPLGLLDVKGVRWLVERTSTMLLFSNPDTHQVRFAAPLP